MQDRRPTIIVPGDPARNVAASSRRSGRRACAVSPVPPRQPGQRPAAAARSAERPDAARRRSTRRTDPRRTASASGSSRRARARPVGTTALAAQWLVEMTRSHVVEVEAARSRWGRAAGSAGSSRAGARQPLDERRADPAALDERRDASPARARASADRPSGNSRQSDSSTFSPPRMPVSQSCTSTTRRPVQGGRGRRGVSHARRPRRARRRPRGCARPIAPTRTP